MIEFKNVIWHIEDFIKPSMGREITLVVQIRTDESVLNIPVKKDLEKRVLELKVYGVNLGRELLYSQEEGMLRIDLGDLKSWTSTPNHAGLIGVNLKIRFMIRDPHFSLSSLDLGYESFFEVYGYRLNYGTLTLPPGLKLGNDGKVDIKTIFKCENEKKVINFKSRVKYTIKEGKKKKYFFHIEKEDNSLVDNEECEVLFRISYKTVNERIYYIISIISFALLLVALIRFYDLITFNPNLKFDIRFLAASVAFLGLFMGLIREGYELPLRRLVFISILFLVLDLGLEIILLK